MPHRPWSRSGTEEAFKDFAPSHEAPPTVQQSISVTTAAPTTRRSPTPCSVTAGHTSFTCGGENRAYSSHPVTPEAPPASPPSPHCGSPNARSALARACCWTSCSSPPAIAPDDVKGPALRSHLEIALAVASGIADVGLGVRAAANDLGLNFIPLNWEPYDIALSGDALGAASPLITALQ